MNIKNNKLMKDLLKILDKKGYVLHYYEAYSTDSCYIKLENGVKELYSYDTLVAYIKADNTPVILGSYSQTTTRHQKEFLKQNGFKANTLKQMLKDYGIGDEY